MHILLADPSRLFQEILQSAFAGEEEVRIVHVGGIREALAAVASRPCQFYIVAGQLADGEGIELARRLRGSAACRTEPIVLLASAPSVELAEAASRAGVTELFDKHEVEELITYMRRSLRVFSPIRCRVVYVEDARDQRLLLQAQLAEWGMQVAAFETAEAAWEHIQAHPCDLLICDVVLGGGMSGSRFINCIRRKSGVLGRIPVIATTAFDDPARRIELFHLGIDDYVAKPIVPLELKTRIQNLMLRMQAEAALVAAKQSAENVSQAKSAFLANMSHELRTPFHGILGTIALARSRMEDAKGLDLLDKARHSAEQLLGVINDVLDISKIEAARLELENVPFSLLPIFENVQSLLGLKAEAKLIRLDVQLPPALVTRKLIGDPTRLSQVLINLCGNAVKFTERGSVSLRVVECGHDPAGLRLRFEVADTGVGIAREVQARLFAPFMQGDNSTSRRYGGTGLGLAICKRLVELMGGQIGVDSVPGQGSNFWFEVTLPEAQCDPAAVPRAPRESGVQRIVREHAGKRVLLVEDEPINQEVSRMMLEDARLVVDLACNGREGVRMAGETRYDLILMDMQMPVMDGIEATMAIRAESRNTATPILAMTANAFAEDRERCLEAGMRDHISKPVIPEKLYETLLRWLDHAE